MVMMDSFGDRFSGTHGVQGLCNRDGSIMGQRVSRSNRERERDNVDRSIMGIKRIWIQSIERESHSVKDNMEHMKGK